MTVLLVPNVLPLRLWCSPPTECWLETTVKEEPNISWKSEHSLPGSWNTTVVTDARPSAVCSWLTGAITGRSFTSLSRKWLFLTDELSRNRRVAMSRLTRQRLGCGFFIWQRNEYVANGRFFIVLSWCSCTSITLLRVWYCLIFQPNTLTETTRKNAEKNTEKNTNKSIWDRSCLKYTWPLVPDPSRPTNTI